MHVAVIRDHDDAMHWDDEDYDGEYGSSLIKFTKQKENLIPQIHPLIMSTVMLMSLMPALPAIAVRMLPTLLSPYCLRPDIISGIMTWINSIQSDAKADSETTKSTAAH